MRLRTSVAPLPEAVPRQERALKYLMAYKQHAFAKCPPQYFQYRYTAGFGHSGANK